MINDNYTLFIRIPVYCNSQDEVFTDELWEKDLTLHLQYIKNFSLCCPVIVSPDKPKGFVRVQGLTRARIFPLRQDRGWGSVLLNLIPNFLRTAQAVASTKIVHSDGAGWPFPLSFYILALRPFLSFKWIVVIESSFWMKPTQRRPSLKEWVRHYVNKSLLTRCLRSAEARIFTHDGYRELFKIEKERSLIAPAVWVDKAKMISSEQHDERLASMVETDVRLLFPARLIPDKGVAVVLEAIEKAEDLLLEVGDAAAAEITLSIIGHGPLLGLCQNFAKNHKGRIKINIHEPLAYGDVFFSFVRRHHVVLLANRQIEQPRIVYDAFSQGVPVISSDTQGVTGIVHDGRNGLLFAIDDGFDLARSIVRFCSDLTLRRHLSRNALDSAKGYSHLEMHQARDLFLARTLGL
jgi:glycosyltransferase involved in cell wall biosynthesis